MVKYLKNNIKAFSNIVHIGDIHIRLTKRHEEYRDVFDKLYKEISTTPIDTAICVLGDILHNKSDLSPEAVQLAHEFLTSLANLRPTILVAGNHDATLANKNRMDSLSPIVNAINHPNLFYLKDSGLYILGDILFNNMSILDDPEVYILGKNIPKKYIYETSTIVSLYHGAVNDAITDIGYTVVNKTITNSLFDNHDIALLGDIHKAQVLQDYNEIQHKAAVVYCGSLIQQNHGENISGHGYVLWNLKNKIYKHINIPNDYGYFTIKIENGILQSDIENIPNKVSLRIQYQDTNQSDIQAMIKSLSDKTKVLESTYIKLESDQKLQSKNEFNNFKIQNLNSVEYQNNLIKSHLLNNNDLIDKSVISDILNINTYINSLIDSESIVKNIKWHPKKFEFDNMFSYGEGNVLDFSKLKDVIGIFSKNASGKSSILSALSFCIFDKCDRAFKATQILNSQKSNFRCQFNFECDGIDFYIERIGIADKKGNVKVDVKFWKIENGNHIELNGEARRTTNDIIRDYIGSYDDFMLTVLSIQNSKAASFIDIGQTERKDLLSKFTGLTIFEKLYTISNDKLKEFNILLKNNYTLFDSDKLDNITSNIKINTNALDNITNQFINVNKTITGLQDDINSQYKKIIPSNIEKLNITSLENDYASVKSKMSQLILSIDNVGINIKNKNIIYDDLKSKAIKLKDKNLEALMQNVKNLKLLLKNKEQILINKKTSLVSKIENLKILESHKYDPDCEFCINNEFVKNAQKTKTEIFDDTTGLNNLINDYKETKKQLVELLWVEEEYSILTTLNSEINDCNSTLLELKNGLLKLELQLKSLEKNRDDIIKNIELFNNNKITMEKNQEIELVIKSINLKLKLELSIASKLENDIEDLNKKIITDNAEKERLNNLLLSIKNLEANLKNYKIYTDTISRDGLQYELIAAILPTIETEINIILSQIVNFTISLQTDKKNISTFIIYQDRKWALELSSGFERFVSSLAIRIALINISNLPRPNFMVIDEGFGCLDSDNIAEMPLLFDYLKHKFDFTLIISHLDSLKDMVDSTITINKDGDFSKINYNP